MTRAQNGHSPTGDIAEMIALHTAKKLSACVIGRRLIAGDSGPPMSNGPVKNRMILELLTLKSIQFKLVYEIQYNQFLSSDPSVTRYIDRGGPHSRA